MKKFHKRGKRILALVLLMAVMFSNGQFVNAADNYAEEQENSGDIYSFANDYFVLKSVKNGQYLLANSAGYEAQAETAEDAMVFYMKPADLGIYIFYDADSKWLNVNWFNAIIRNTDRNDGMLWKLEAYDGENYVLYSVLKNKYIKITGTSLKWSDTVTEDCYFKIEEAEGNNPYPEADTCIDIYGTDGNMVDAANAMSTPEVGEEIIGYADTHGHINHNLGSGQVTFVMDAFHPYGITEALNSCAGWHGNGGTLDIWGAVVDGKTGHNTDGYPDFTYWPTSYSTNHQQTYYKWLERSYLAGQRVFVQQCVNNEILGEIMNTLPPYKGAPTDDMTVARLQIENIYKMQDYIDAQCGGPGEGWFRIVKSSAEAREVISRGKMAVFLGLEMDTVFGCDTDYIGEYEAGNISEEEMNAHLENISNQLDEFYALGVRSVFPVHALNNGFGGCQLYQGEVFSVMNKLKAGDYYQPEVSSNPRVYYKQPKANLPEDAQGHGNSVGLTKTGEWLIHQLIDRRIIIEVDHMSDKTFNAVLDICWGEKYPGIIASHTRILDMYDPEDEAWEQMDIPRMIKVLQLGGVISPMLWETLDEHQMCVSDYQEFMIELSESGEPQTAILDNEKYQKYGGPYEVPTTWYNQNEDSSDDLILGIPYGSDVNGACMLPNFDNFEGVYANVNYDDGSFNALYEGVYSEQVETVQFQRQVTGNRTFDINGDRGVAHYGLIPDMLEKLSSRSDRVNIDATYHSAEAYLRMMNRTERYSDTYPSRDVNDWPEVSNE